MDEQQYPCQYSRRVKCHGDDEVPAAAVMGCTATVHAPFAVHHDGANCFEADCSHEQHEYRVIPLHGRRDDAFDTHRAYSQNRNTRVDYATGFGRSPPRLAFANAEEGIATSRIRIASRDGQSGLP